MSKGLNRWSGLGNLGDDAELRLTQGGAAVLNFRVACTTSYRDKDGKDQERTEWVTCVVWGKRAEALSQFLKKGTHVFVEGELRTSSYEDKEKIKRYKTEITVDTLELLGGGKGEGGSKSDKFERREEKPAPQQSARSRREAAPEEKAPWE